MKKLLLLLTLILAVSLVSLAAETSKTDIKKETEEKSQQEQKISQVFVFHLQELKFEEVCCDNSTRTTYIIYDDNDPLGSIYIPDPMGDCPICPPE